jgi:hypothetical protein
MQISTILEYNKIRIFYYKRLNLGTPEFYTTWLMPMQIAENPGLAANTRKQY